MTRVCLVGTDDANLRYELLSSETARDALATYDLGEPFENSVAVGTVSLGAAVSLLNDVDWHLARFAREALVLEPSVSDDEYLSRDLTTAVRSGTVDADETGRFLKMYGLVFPGTEGADGPPRLVEPMYVTRTGGTLPEYDLGPVADTLVVRVTEEEFG